MLSTNCDRAGWLIFGDKTIAHWVAATLLPCKDLYVWIIRTFIYFLIYLLRRYSTSAEGL